MSGFQPIPIPHRCSPQLPDGLQVDVEAETPKAVVKGRLPAPPQFGEMGISGTGGRVENNGISHEDDGDDEDKLLVAIS